MFYVEAPVSGPTVRTFSAAFPREQISGPSSRGDAQDGQTASATVELNMTNLTSAAFAFTFIDNYRFAALSPAGATFRVTSPEGNSSEAVCQPGGSYSAAVQFSPINLPPEEMILVAGDENAAQKAAGAKNPACETGVGQWTIEITVQRAYASPVHPLGGSISWSLTTRVECYSLEVTELHRS
jgi:hypothetical protein